MLSPSRIREIAKNFLRESCGDINEEEYLCESLAYTFLIRLKCRKNYKYF